MKKFLIIVLVLAVAIGIGLVAGRIIKNKTGGLSPTALLNVTSKTPATPKFVWGVQGGAYVLNRLKDPYRIENVDKQIKSLKELGVNTVRVNLEISRQDSPFQITPQEAANDDYISKLSQAGFDIVLVLDPDVPQTIGKANYEQEGYKLASYAAKRYRDKVKYFQVANEVSGTIAKPQGYTGKTFKGENNIDYSQERYDAILGWAKGMSRGIREQSKNAEILLCGHWILYDIVQKLANDKVDFDIIGWSWYSSDGVDPTQREFNYGQSLNLAEKLNQIKKDVWIIEANRDAGSYNKQTKKSDSQGEQEQGQYLAQVLDNIYKSGYFKGFFVFTLLDNPVAEEQNNPEVAHLGLVEVKKISGDNQIIKNKPAFDIFKNFIATHQDPS